ncbi:MAG: hypothetical protein N0C81_04510 [Candidatus Thiodiazotropha lotti]|uniref:Uncharacterized protein n=1 Tax=Candidatus Thiodiazotropha lotti TaxID=2792787 RepID=A0A9E4K6D1_9GAMM|nr:hypothetical protein [Candidatus Thiodiazotropha lotti]MCG7923550.1 hypothetical protein [Candidatus Thiodiazotropha lotti]MCG7931911.1 hypothetical protein [Candidatus Thiodiazotropha lotti]MCG7939656.1 hypothetical protein [Candidatus Thiodiazotropha lotti]MCG7989071.1 hypothetical protein [Candidatus Thiodiazotropha lotti]
MEIASLFAVMMIGALLLMFKKTQSKANAKQNQVDELQEQIETALSLPGESDEAWQNEPATEVMLNELAEKDIRLKRELTKGQAMNILGLFSPPDGRQVDILKHFNIPYSFKMNQTMAHYVIREIFSDPVKVEEWNNRPPTTTVRQGLLFMESKLVSGLTHQECQLRLNKLGMEHPDRYQEWKQIDRLFLETNNPEIRAKLQVRKITWKRFFESYEVLKDSGINPRAMRGEHIIEHLIRSDDKILAHDKIRETIQPATT